MQLTQKSTLIPLLQKYNLYSQKSFGQHFLVDQSVLDSVVDSAKLTKDDMVIEIGAGTGVLTRELAVRAGEVQAFEIDVHLKPLLQETLADFDNISLQFGDFLAINLNDIVQPGQKYKVVANLPYNVGSHIMDRFIKHSTPPVLMSVLLQKEVAEKMTSLAPDGTYLGNFLHWYGETSLVRKVPAGCFFPVPRVESAVLLTQQREERREKGEGKAIEFSRFLHRGFGQPRKKINKAFDKGLLAEAGINPDLRPEHVSFEEWQRLFELV